MLHNECSHNEQWKKVREDLMTTLKYLDNLATKRLNSGVCFHKKRPGIHGMNHPPQTGTGFQDDWTVRNNKSQIEMTFSLDKGNIMPTISTAFCPQQTYMCKIMCDESPQKYVSFSCVSLVFKGGLWPHHIILNSISWMHLSKWIWNDKR